LLKIVQNYSCLDELSLHVGESQHLSECLPYIAYKETVGSLAAHEEFELLNYSEFLEMSKNVKENAGTGSEPFPGEFLKPMKKEVKLTPEVLALLVKYYHSAYGYSFVDLSNIHTSPSESIVVLPKANQFARLRLGAEIFGSTFSARHLRSANILAQFILDDDTTDTYPGQVQFFFEHSIVLPGKGSVTHSLAFVRWYKSADDRRSRFHCQISDDDKDYCNIELWKHEFYELERDCIIPIHSILGRFVAGTMTIGRKTPNKYLSVVPINRKIHI
jgi:hypothetical protein